MVAGTWERFSAAKSPMCQRRWIQRRSVLSHTGGAAITPNRSGMVILHCLNASAVYRDRLDDGWHNARMISSQTLTVTLAALEKFPGELEQHFSAFEPRFAHWAPPSWEGVPSEPFTAIEQLCHVRDIEIEGYQTRIRRMLQEMNPMLPSIDSEMLARERGYGNEDGSAVIAEFRTARAQTIDLIRALDATQFERTAIFEGYGAVTLRGLVHYLCSHDQQHLAGLQWLLGKVSRPRSEGLSGERISIR
jgi:hypothetical protein